VRTSGHLAVVVNPGASLGLAAFYAAVIAERPVGIAVEERRGVYVGSVRSRDPRIDLNTALRKVALEVGGSGGGHPGAAGFRVPIGSFERFLRALEEVIQMQLTGRLKGTG